MANKFDFGTVKNIMKWTKEKPKFNKECLLIVASKFIDDYDYTIYQIKKLQCDEGWYWGILTGDGDEWGDINDIAADLYLTIPLIKK